MKPARIFQVIFFLIIALFFPVYGLQWSVFTALLAFLLSFLYSRIVAHGFRVTRRDSVLRTYRFQPAEVELVAENRSPLPIHYISLTDSAGSLFTNDGEKLLLSFRPYEKKILTYSVQGYSRGEYRIGPIRLHYSDPLGLFPWYRQIASELRFIVYPNVVPIELLVKEGLPAGNIKIENPIYEDVTRYRSLREYVPGDETRRIHWKVSARAGKLHSMEFLPSLYFPALIVLNLSFEDYAVKHRFHATERAIEIAASLVFAVIERKQSLGFITSGVIEDEGHPAALIRSGHAHAVSILESLARVRMSRAGVDCTELLLSSGIRVPLGCRLIYIGPVPKQEQFSLLLSARNGNSPLELYVLPQDGLRPDLPPTRSVRVYYIKDHGDELTSES